MGVCSFIYSSESDVPSYHIAALILATETCMGILWQILILVVITKLVISHHISTLLSIHAVQIGWVNYEYTSVITYDVA